MKPTLVFSSTLLVATVTLVLAQDAKDDKAAPAVTATVCTPESIKQNCEALHSFYTDKFVSSVGFGYERMINIEEAISSHQWQIGQDNYTVRGIQLISLLKHDPPVVYPPVTFTTQWNHKQTPPVPAKIGDQEARALNEFETAALKQLKEKKENMVVKGDPIMVGALRAETSCLKCHDCNEGDLLGAFSYTMVKVSAKDAQAPTASDAAPADQRQAPQAK